MLSRENAPRFTAIFVDEHHDQLGCPGDRKDAWKTLSLWASIKLVPIILLSATAPPCLEKRLLRNYKLRMGSTAFIRSGTDRPEIGLHTVQLDPLLAEEALSHLVHALKGRLEEDERMLVFFGSCVLAAAFAEKSRCAVFHSRLPTCGNTKAYNLDKWDKGEATVMACTSAFASGVVRLGLGGASRRAKRGGERGIISSDETKQVTG